MVLRLVALIALAASVFFLQQAAMPIIEQNRKVREWPAVDSTVTVRAVETPAESLQVRWVYEVGGVRFHTNKVVPRALEWMPADATHTPAGESAFTRRGHYDPAKPDDLLIPRPFGIRDYWPFFVWAPFLGVGVSALMLRKSARSAAGAMRREAQKSELPLIQKHSLGRLAKGAWIAALVCNAVIGFAAFDYFTGEPRIRTGAANALAGIGFVPGLVIVGFAIHFTRRDQYRV